VTSTSPRLATKLLQTREDLALARDSSWRARRPDGRRQVLALGTLQGSKEEIPRVLSLPPLCDACHPLQSCTAFGG